MTIFTLKSTFIKIKPKSNSLISCICILSILLTPVFSNTILKTNCYLSPKSNYKETKLSSYEEKHVEKSITRSVIYTTRTIIGAIIGMKVAAFIVEPVFDSYIVSDLTLQFNLSFFKENFAYAVIALLYAIIIHEKGHLYFKKFFKTDFAKLIGGPIANLFFGILSLPFILEHFYSPYISLITSFAYWNIAVGVGALIPLDIHSGGGAILRSIERSIINNQVKHSS